MTAADLDELLAAVGAPPGGPDDALELGSLAVVQLVDLVEAVTGLVLGSREVTRANFATRAAVLATLAELGAGRGPAAGGQGA